MCFWLIHQLDTSRWLIGIELWYGYFIIMKKLVIKFSDLVCKI